METGTLYQVSLVASFVAGMVALFAPCCVSYLLPAYLGNVFKERKQVLLMTLIYSLGILVVLLPVVLGARVLSRLFLRLHDQTYIAGGLLMLVVSVLSFLGIKLPMPSLSFQQKPGTPDLVSTFTLGMISGITSACCAPVLVGVITLSSLSPTIIQSLGVGASYVLGMVTPLYLASLFIEKGNLLEKPVLKKKLTVLRFRNQDYPIFVANLVAGAIFLVTGILMVVLAALGRLEMATGESAITKRINEIALTVTDRTNALPGINLIFAVIVLYLLSKLIKGVLR